MILIQRHDPIDDPSPILQSIRAAYEEVIAVEYLQHPGLQRLHKESASAFEDIEQYLRGTLSEGHIGERFILYDGKD